MKEVIISKENANFWLDAHGNWCNIHGRFQHKKIIDYFHMSISRDSAGYHLKQINNNQIEKVYFRYEDTALFVFSLIINEKWIEATLNTRKEVQILPSDLFMESDDLYAIISGERIKFNEHSLFELSKIIECQEDLFFIRIGGTSYPISSR